MMSQSAWNNSFDKATLGVRIVNFISLSFHSASYVYNVGQLAHMGIGETMFSFAVVFSALLFPILIRNPLANLIFLFLIVQIFYELISHFDTEFFITRGAHGVPFRNSLIIIIGGSIVVWGVLIFRGLAKLNRVIRNREGKAQ